MNILKLIPFIFIAFYASITSADSTHLERGKRALIAMGYTYTYKNSAMELCDEPIGSNYLSICKYVSNICNSESVDVADPHCINPISIENLDKLIVDVAAPHFIKVVSIENLDKIIDFWESDIGKEISKKFILGKKPGEESLLTETEKKILEELDKTEENKAAWRFILNQVTQITICWEIEIALSH